MSFVAFVGPPPLQLPSRENLLPSRTREETPEETVVAVGPSRTTTAWRCEIRCEARMETLGRLVRVVGATLLQRVGSSCATLGESMWYGEEHSISLAFWIPKASQPTLGCTSLSKVTIQSIPFSIRLCVGSTRVEPIHCLPSIACKLIADNMAESWAPLAQNQKGYAVDVRVRQMESWTNSEGKRSRVSLPRRLQLSNS